jgi:flagellar hook protein FlgE
LLGSAGSGGLGEIRSGVLESSNVDITEQLVNMITAQRNFQANAKVVSTADQLAQSIINLR